MGILTKLFIDASDKEFKLAQDLVAIAIADGEISEAERKAITEICQREGVSNDTVNSYLLGYDEDVVAKMPAKHLEKIKYLANLIRVMGGWSKH